MPNPRAPKPLTLEQVKNDLQSSRKSPTGGAAFGVYPRVGRRGQMPSGYNESVFDPNLGADQRAMSLPEFGEIDLDIPTASNRAMGQRMTERQADLKRQADRDTSPLEKLAGAMQAARLMGSGLTQAVKSIPTAVTKGGKAAEEYIAENIYKPTQPKAYEYAGDVGDFLSSLETDYKLPPIMPEAVALQGLISPATRQAKRAAGQAARQGAANLAAPRTLGSQAGAVVYHGSPHKFDKFSPKKIGTGEGSQAYGHGLYFAQSPDVAKTYQPRSPQFEEKLIKLYEKASSAGNYPMMEVLEDAMLHKTPDEIVKKFANTDDGYTGQHAKAAKDFVNWYSKNEPEVGGLYTVDLPDEKISRMLDYDKPLSAQHPDVQKALLDHPDILDYMAKAEAQRTKLNEMSPVRLEKIPSASVPYDASRMAGKDVMTAIAQRSGLGGEQGAIEEQLRQLGIPGIRYLDEQSRGATGTGRYKIKLPSGEEKIYDFKPNDDAIKMMNATIEPYGTQNFVVFPGEEDALTILDRKKEGGSIHTSDSPPREYGKGGFVKRTSKAAKSGMFNPDVAITSARRGTRFEDTMPPTMGVIKEKGGNWLGGSVEGALKPLKRNTVAGNDPVEMLGRMRERYTPEEIAKLPEGVMKQHILNSFAELERDVALNNWVERNLGNYVKKEMATPEDPVRRLAEEGISHLPENTRMPRNMSSVADRREAAGFPEAQGRSQQAQVWEALSDDPIRFATAGEMQNVGKGEPWMEKADPFTRVHSIGGLRSDSMTSELGLDHIMDVLREDLTSGRIRPEQLNKVSMEQAVRRTAEYDQEMAKKMRETALKQQEGFPVAKEYPEGYRWVELTTPKNMKLPEGYSVKPDPITNRKTGVVDTNSYRLVDPEGKLVGWGKTEDEAVSSGLGEKVLADALKYEGDTMGHCVGGYCPDVLEGKSRIYSLRDAKGEPHVTVEVQPNQHLDYNKWYSEQPTSYKALLNAKRSEPGYDPYQEPAYLAAREALPPKIVQIKGKQNRAPKEDYLPYVQDFVKSGQWSDVGDLGNTGLYKADPGELGMFIPSDPRLKNLPGRRTEDFEKAKEAGLFGDQKYFTRNEWEDILRRQIESESGPLPPPEEMAHGGRVHFSNNPDTMALELAGGGGVSKLAMAGAKGAQNVLPAAVREANKAKFLEGSKTPMRLYHGTTATEGGKRQEAIRRIKPSKEGALGSGVYLTPNSAHASGYSGIPNDEALAAMAGDPYAKRMADQFMADRASGTLREGQEGGNMLPVLAQMRNPLILEGKGDPMIEALVKLGVDQDSASKMVERAYEQKGYIGKQVQQRAQAAGYDGLMQYRDGDLSEVVSYNPNAVKSDIGNRGTYDINEPDLSKAAGGAVRMQVGGAMKAAKAASKPIVKAPGIVMPSGLSQLKEAIRQSKGDYGARRVERAADEIPNLERLYKEQALREAFGGDNAKALMTMNPADFEKYAVELQGRTPADIGPKMAELAKQGEIDKYTVPTDEYIQHLMRVQGGFDDVPYLNLFKDEVGLPSYPEVRGHEGRHRSRALSEAGEPSSLVQISPRGDLREGLPRGSQEEYIEALREELERSNRLVLPERDGSYRRPPIELPDPYAAGGAVRMSGGGALAKLGAKGAAKGAKEAAVPLSLPRVRPSTKDILEAAERVGKQQAGEFVKSPLLKETTNLAGRSKKEVERLKALEYKTTPIKDLPEIKPYEAKVGEVNVALPGDQTISDMLLESIDDIPVGTTAEGGALFGRGRLADPEESRAFWASNIGPADIFQRKVTELAKLYDTDMITAYHLAMGQTANNFAQHLADANMRAIDFSKLDKKKMNAFDSEIANGFYKKDKNTGKVVWTQFPDWPGIANPQEALDAMKENPELRKWFNSRAKTETLTKKLDLPYGKAIEWAMSEPELRNMEINLTGLSAGRMKPGAELIPESAHQTYSHDIPGTALGKAPELAPFSISFPDATAFVREKYRAPDFTGTIQKVFPHQVVDEAYLEDMYKYYTQLRNVRGFNKGGAVSYADGGEITADDLILEERKL